MKKSSIICKCTSTIKKSQSRKNLETETQTSSTSQIPHKINSEQFRPYKLSRPRAKSETHLSKYASLIKNVYEPQKEHSTCQICKKDIREKHEHLLMFYICEHRFHYSCLDSVHERSQINHENKGLFLMCPKCSKF